MTLQKMGGDGDPRPSRLGLLEEATDQLNRFLRRRFFRGVFDFGGGFAGLPREHHQNGEKKYRIAQKSPIEYANNMSNLLNLGVENRESVIRHCVSRSCPS